MFIYRFKVLWKKQPSFILNAEVAATNAGSSENRPAWTQYMGVQWQHDAPFMCGFFTWKVKNGHIFTRGNGHRWTVHPMEHILLWTFHFGRDSDASVRMVSIHPLIFIGLILNNPDCWEVLVYIYLYGVALIIRLFQHTFFFTDPEQPFTNRLYTIYTGFPTWRIIPVSKWLITMVSKSPK